MIVLRQANKHSRNSCRCHIIGGCGTVALTQRRAMQKARAIWRRVDRAQGQGAEDPASSREARIYSRGCAALGNRDGMQGGFCSKYRDICKKTNAADRPSQVIARRAE